MKILVAIGFVCLLSTASTGQGPATGNGPQLERGATRLRRTIGVEAGE